MEIKRPMKHRAKAQSLIEYATVAMIVVLALVFGGPFLINSINGRFRLMNNNVHDSLNEQVKQATPPAVPICRCTDFIINACGIPPCGATEMNFSRICSPIDCQPELKCEPDPSCVVTVPVDPCAGGGCVPSCAAGWLPLCP